MQDFEREPNFSIRTLVIGWTIALLLSVGMSAVIIWAIIKLVSHFTV